MILGISFDTPEANARFAEKHGFPYRLLSDADHSIALAYGACESVNDQYPHRYTFVIGPDGIVEQSIDTSSPGKQAERLLETL